MKLDKSYLFIGVSSVALFIVLIIQVNWIFQTAQINEQIFNEKANMVLSRTADALNADKETRKKMEICVGSNEGRKIDSLLKHYMKFYNLQIGYYFEVEPGTLISPSSFTSKNNTCRKSLGETDYNSGFSPNKGLALKLVFPDKEEFIMAEMGLLFITSVVLIIVVLILFWRTISSLMKEKKISEHTTDYLNNMTHEFKTPLTNIALAGKMMIKDQVLKQEDKIRHYSGIILEENEKLIHQVEQVLSMTALERGEIPLRKSELDIHQLIHQVLKSISVQVENKQGQLQLHLDAERFVIMGDKTHLANALSNLIDNAIKYCREKPELIVRTANKDDHLILSVSDNGIGIEDEYQHRVFDKFFRVPTGDVHDVKGFGLGLAYVKAIVELHGGTISLQSEAGEGTTFTITLPNA